MVKPMMNKIREASMRMMPQSCPGVPERIACGGYGVLRKDVLRPPAFGMIELNLRHFGRRNVCDCVIRDIDHRMPPRSFPSGRSVGFTRPIYLRSGIFSYSPPDLYVALITALRPDK